MTDATSDFGGPRLASAGTAPTYDFHVVEDEHAHEHHETGTMLGFWLYLMSDCLLFGILFAVHAVLGQNYAAGPSPADLFEVELILISTFMLLFSSITYGFAMIQMQQGSKNGTLLWLGITGIFGAVFLGISIYEFNHLWHIGATPMASAFLSSFYLLVGTHALHVGAGIIWLIVLLAQVQQKGLIEANTRRVACLSLFWHFLDLIWIAVFSFVYLTGVLL
ncbi:MAG: cytochrome o ubiquinol oxidase subunit III [Pseudomonadota bacterium]